MFTSSRRLLPKLLLYKCFSKQNNLINQRKTLRAVLPVVPIIYRKFCENPVSATPGTTETEEDRIVKEICGADAELEKKLRVLMLEKEMVRQEGGRSPNHMTIDQWKELMQLPSRSARKKFLAFLFIVEKKKESRDLKKSDSQVGAEARKAKKREEIANNPHIAYGLSGSTIFLRIYDQTMNQAGNNRLVQAMQFGSKIVLDCGYDGDMTHRENANAAKQLLYSFAENRDADEPFDLHFCNCNKSSVMMKQFEKHIPIMYEPWFPINIHENSYLDVFPKEKLIYLTPHCREDMTRYDSDAVYIIGALVDKTNSEPLSMAKAKREGLRMQRLPLDRFLQWDSGSGKSLTINQMMCILLELKRTGGDWDAAFKHVPRRKIIDRSTLEDGDFVDRFEKNREKNVRMFKQRFTKNIDLLLESQIEAIKQKKNVGRK